MAWSIILNVTALHIPDGFLSVPVALIGWLITITVIGFTLRQTRDLLGERQIPMLGVMAAFVFAAQTINFPIFGGTSGHLIGGALIAIVLGPWPAVLAMTVVVGLQALLFQDGGILAIGWNVTNMAVLTVLTGALTFGLIRRLLGSGRKSLILSSMVAAWLSVVLGAIATGVELAASDPGLLVALPAMAGIHGIIGIGEALITGAAVLLIARTRPALVESDAESTDYRSAYVIAAGLVVALVVATLSVISSPSPDGLERVALDFGFADRVIEPVVKLLPGYSSSFLGGEIGQIVIIAGGAILSCLLVVAIAKLIVRLLSRAKANARAGEKSAEISSAGD